MAKIKTCKQCGKQFRMIDMEINFYTKQGYPDPENCPPCRQKRRISLCNPEEFFKRNCDRCGKETITTHNPKKKLTVFCDDCFQDYYNHNELVTKG